LGEVTPASGGGKVAFEQTVNGELNPTIKLGDQLIAWNPATKKIAKDGEWTYDIKPGAGPFDNGAIGRRNTKSKSEFWHHDGAKGEEIVQGIDGVKKVTSWFTSGKLAGKARKRETLAGDQQLALIKKAYDESGFLFLQYSKFSEDLTETRTSLGSGIMERRLTTKNATHIMAYSDGNLVFRLTQINK
jgi:hypothetical protein